MPSIMLHEKAVEYAILRHYENSNNFLILDERVEISKAQLNELIKIINEIKEHLPEARFRSEEEIIISTAGNIVYVIKDETGTTVVFGWHRRYNYDRSRDIEKTLGLKSYMRCPCLEKDLEQMGKSQNRRRRLFNR
ncbi:MAG: hypothetical protein FWC98_00560 [Bacteroidales bacterium]|nr:hypothetical protein [Bacteroidales bacterium]